jgi:hypothetical protein
MMDLYSKLRAVSLLAVLPFLSGCVAAAIPALAAGGVLTTQVDLRGVRPALTGEPRIPIDISAPAAKQDAAFTRSYTMPDGTRIEVMTGAAAPTPTP